MDEEFIRDFFASEGAATLRRMFGGLGVYLDGPIVAIVLRDELLLKADDETSHLFEAAGATRWQYQRDGRKPVTMPYFSVPAEALDDPEAMAIWARRACEAGMRDLKRKTSRRRRRKPTALSRSA